MPTSPASITITCNTRPDADEILWLMIQDSAGDHYAPHLAQYFDVAGNHAPGAVTVSSQIFLGIAAPAYRLTGIIREISRYFTGTPLAARFSECRDQYIDGAVACGHEVVGPVMVFTILPSDRTVSGRVILAD